MKEKPLLIDYHQVFSGSLFKGHIYVFSPGVLGFTGLHVYNLIQAKHFYLGSALWVNFEEG